MGAVAGKGREPPPPPCLSPAPSLFFALFLNSSFPHYLGAWNRQPRPQGLLAFQYGGGSGEDPGTQQITCLQRGWRCIQNGGYGEKGEKNWVRDAKVKMNKMAEKAEVQFKKK